MRTSEHRYPPSKKAKPRKGLLAVILAVSIVAAGSGIGALLFNRSAAKPESTASSQSAQPVFGSVKVEGVSLQGMTLAKARAAVISHVESKDTGRSYTLTGSEKSYTLSGKDLHITYNINATLQKALNESAADPTDTKDYSLTPVVDQTTLKTRLEELTQPVNQEAKEPTIKSFDGSSFTFTDGTPGVQVDLTALLADTVKAVTAADSGEIAIPTTETPCKYTAADLKGKIQKLGSFTTQSVNTENGTYNMSRALKTVNGTVVAPGGVFSFLGIVGNADKDNGYKMAGALENGVGVQAYGGGICQASSTIYGAVLRSNGEITERSPHSSPSVYVPIGLDATVAYPYLDFKFRNPTDYPMYIQSGADGRTMYCTVYGYKDDSWDKIEVNSKETGTVAPPADVVKVDKTKPVGYREETVKPLSGHYATSSRTFYKNGSVVRTETLFKSYYPPRAAVYVVGPSAAAASSTTSSKPASSSKPTTSSTSSTASSKPAA
ncbi:MULTISPECIES: VanW family protein [Caproicibacterium]|uniref:VanW family protein n=1 Tax=Caproicibacterium argilliputei TaxID=3030016 RepID=A0AA97H0X7_9FIRM|nr:VanW family protein [Caproicibacterium argilliputei]WOC32041.1 VanW family protein [Caproicibacterium argilliputei]